MNARRKAFTSVAAVPRLGAAALVLAALVVVIGSAQAAPSTKVYDATVRVVSGPVTGTSATLRLTLTNSTRSKQTLGSANFTKPTGITLGSVTNVSRPQQFTAQLQGTNVVAFRSTVALKPGELVFADVAVTTTANCSNATWTTQVKQSNDFSGTGNDFAPGTSSNLRPVGSLAIEDIGTLVDNPATPETETLFVPQIRLSPPNDPTAVGVSADDICGADYIGYGTPSKFGTGATLEAKAATPPRLVAADISGITWNSNANTGFATVAPVDVETGDQLVVTDTFTGISTNPSTRVSGDSNEFDVVEKICTTFDVTCHWENSNGKIKVDAAGPPGNASLGIGFNPDLSLDCNGKTTPVGGTLVNINPRNYEPGSTVTITLTYDKSIAGGNASNYSLCLSKDNGESWGEAPVPACPSSTPVIGDAPCILEQKKTNGNLSIVLYLKAVDPWGGLT
jgi:hypothetical protein